jgi:YHS domain-containing protein
MLAKAGIGDLRGDAKRYETVTVDPVCDMEVEESSVYRLQHDGTTYFFCSEKCLQKFERDPGAFTKNREKSADEKPYRGPSAENVRQEGRGANLVDYIPLVVIVALTVLAACAKQYSYPGAWDWMGMDARLHGLFPGRIFDVQVL